MKMASKYMAKTLCMLFFIFPLEKYRSFIFVDKDVCHCTNKFWWQGQVVRDELVSWEI